MDEHARGRVESFFSESVGAAGDEHPRVFGMMEQDEVVRGSRNTDGGSKTAHDHPNRLYPNRGPTVQACRCAGETIRRGFGRRVNSCGIRKGRVMQQCFRKFISNRWVSQGSEESVPKISNDDFFESLGYLYASANCPGIVVLLAGILISLTFVVLPGISY